MWRAVRRPTGTGRLGDDDCFIPGFRGRVWLRHGTSEKTERERDRIECSGEIGWDHVAPGSDGPQGCVDVWH